MELSFKTVKKRRRRVSVYLEESLYTAVQARAKETHRSFNGYVVNVLYQAEAPAK